MNNCSQFIRQQSPHQQQQQKQRTAAGARKCNGKTVRSYKSRGKNTRLLLLATILMTTTNGQM